MLVADFNATTPQSKAVVNILRVLTTLDMNKAGPLFSKDFKYQTFPKNANLPDEPKAMCMERYGVMLSLVKEVDFDLHEVIEAPGKVVIHWSAVCETHDGDRLHYDSVCIYTLIEEEGELKVDGCKDFCDPEKRDNLHNWAAKTLAKRAT